MVSTNRSFFILVFCLALLSAGSIHLLNREALLREAPARLQSGVTVVTMDDASYLRPPTNWLEGNGWRSSAVGTAAYTTRSPGYGLFYGIFRSVLNETSALWMLFISQLLLFALSCGLLFYIGLFVGLTRLLALLLAIMVAVLPTFSGFLSYTLTEGIVPPMVVIFIYTLFRPYKNVKAGLWLSAAVLGAILLIRPAMLVWVFTLVGFVLWCGPYPILMRVKQLSVVLIIALMPIGLWQFRNHQIAKVGVNLHPIYHTDSPGLYRPLHAAIWDFHKMWGQSGADFHESMDLLWNAAQSGVASEIAAEKVVNALPAGARDAFAPDSLQSIYAAYVEVLRGQVPLYNVRKPMEKGETAPEIALRQTFDAMQKQSVVGSPWFTLVVVPVKVYWSMGAHSNLSLYVFQKAWRGQFCIEALRVCSFAGHLLVFLLFPFSFIGFRNAPKLLLIAVPVAVYLFYLAAFQRGVEERYTLPILVPMCICVLVFFSDMAKKRKEKHAV